VPGDKKVPARWTPTQAVTVPFAMLIAVSLGCRRDPDTLLGTTSGGADSVFSDDRLFAAAYSDYTLPPDFYVGPDGPVHYVNTGSIVDARHRQAPPWTELSTEDPTVARAWAESTVAYSNAVGAIPDTPPIVTERYFEFAVEPRSGLTRQWLRVHRSSYLTDLLTRTPGPDKRYAAFHAPRISAANVRPLGEYLWTHSGAISNPGSKPLSSFAIDTPTDVSHSIYVVRIRDDLTSSREGIILTRLNLRVDKVSGEVRAWSTVVREIPGRQD
jgi:hypothetical protein